LHSLIINKATIYIMGQRRDINNQKLVRIIV
jgi:hypothetical protein